MSLLALLAGSAGATTPAVPPGPQLYNVNTFLAFTDPYGHNGSVVHPDVLDFGVGGWNGHRYWMACTPYYGKNPRQENPSIYYSDVVTTFTEATTNPVYPPPVNPAQWNSDTELLHDRDTDELVLIYRDGTFTPQIARSSNGTTWPATPTAGGAWPGVAGELVSPAYHHDGTQWVAWAIAHPSRIMYRWTAPALEGPWSTPIVCTGWSTDIWHFNIIQHGGRLLCIMHEGWTIGTTYAASSVDGGLTWTKNPYPVLAVRGAGHWDGTELYRSAFVLHENGTDVRVWYCGLGDGSDSWRLGYTEIPLTAWP